MAVETMRDIKRRIKSVASTEHITKAMKLVSAAKLRRAKDTFLKTQDYFLYLNEAIQEIFHNADEVPKKYLEGNREIKTTCYIVITSCRGLCGSFNSNVIKATRMLMRGKDSKPEVLAIGTKGRDYFKKRNCVLCGEYLLPPEDISFVETHIISKPLLLRYEKGEIDEIILVHNAFVSSLSQKVVHTRLLPVVMDRNPDMERHKRQVDYDPSMEEVFNYLVPKLVENSIYGAIVESATCEHGARRMAMDSATENANTMMGQLSLKYNRARQSAITNELSEIVSGAEALK